VADVPPFCPPDLGAQLNRQRAIVDHLEEADRNPDGADVGPLICSAGGARGTIDGWRSRWWRVKPRGEGRPVAAGKEESAMKKVVTTRDVDIALRTLEDDNRRRMQTWFGQLANWDRDEWVRTHSHSLDSIPGVYVLQTNTDFRIFFKMQGNTITVINIGSRQAILAFGRDPEAT
jgi:hypothetical protein